MGSRVVVNPVGTSLQLEAATALWIRGIPPSYFKNSCLVLGDNRHDITLVTAIHVN